MHIRKHTYLAPIGLGIMLLIGILFLWPSASANAQCGSQASSCKNCHETQGKDPVNTDGTGWHVSHAFGDFCYICHAGNNQSMDQEQAHTGMVAPLSDVNAACASCHPADLMDRANVYAAALGIEVGTGEGTSAPPTASGSQGSEPAPNPPAEPAAPAMVIDNAQVMDYSQIYDETVLGKQNTNWGNVILWLIILGTAIGGGFFVYWNERRLRGLPLVSARPGKGDLKTFQAPVVEGYTSEVTSLLPLIAQLDPAGLHSLKKILANPDQANELLHSLSQLDPELIRRLRALDRDSRALLLAVAGD